MSAMARKLLCADAEQQVALTSRGLDPTLLEAPWLTVCSRARAAREANALGIYTNLFRKGLGESRKIKNTDVVGF